MIAEETCALAVFESRATPDSHEAAAQDIPGMVPRVIQPPGHPPTGLRLTRRIVTSVALLSVGGVSTLPAGAALPGRNGLLAVVVTADGARETHRIDLITTDGRFVRRLRCLDRRCLDLAPAWAPGGRELAYSTDSRGGRLVIVRADGTHRRVIPPPSADTRPTGPTWSPDGTRIAFALEPSGLGRPEVYTVGRDGTGLERIGSGIQGWASSWSSTGRIAVTSWGPPPTKIMEIRTFRARDGGDLRRFWPGGTHEWAPDWSPRAARIAFGRTIERGVVGMPRLEVWTVRSDGTGQRRLAIGSDPAWSPDGRFIAFVRDGRLYAIPAGGGVPRRIRYTPPGFGVRRTWLSGPAWQPLPR
jgi:Tol biopolymer transport system component